MDNPAAPAASLNVEQLLHLHNVTKDVSKVCQKQLRSLPRHLWPFCSGPAASSATRWKARSASPSAAPSAPSPSSATSIAGRPAPIRSSTRTHVPLESVSTQMQLYEWEYAHEIKTDRGWRTIKVTSPLTWVVTYSSDLLTFHPSPGARRTRGARRRGGSRLRPALLPHAPPFHEIPRHRRIARRTALPRRGPAVAGNR